MENEPVERYDEWNLDNKCPYHTLADGEPLTYRQLLAKASENCKGQFGGEWTNIWKTIDLFSSSTYNLGIEGYTSLPHNQQLNYDDSDFMNFRDAANTLRAYFYKNFTPTLLGLVPTEPPKILASKRYDALYHDLDFGLNILEVNAKGYIGSLT